MTNEKTPPRLDLIAKQRAEETAAKQAQYNAGILGNVGLHPPMKRLSDLPFSEITRLSYIRGLMSCAEALWQDSLSLAYTSAEWDIEATKAKARERVKILENVIELLKVIEGV
jgi:hypothetical protein